MPKLTNPTTEDRCFYCGCQAYYISINTSRKRCHEKVTSCPSVTAKQQRERDKKWSSYKAKQKHMKELSKKGHITLNQLRKDPEWVQTVKHKQKQTKQQQDWFGHNNPKYGKMHTYETRKRMQASAAKRDNTNVGKYPRTEFHRRKSSENITKLQQQGRLYKYYNTGPELQMISVLEELGIDYEQQYLIQEGWLGGSGDWFRHCYDFKLTGTNILIEVDGTYWHSSERQQKRDKECETRAINKGFMLLRFSETQLKNEPEQVFESVRQLLSNCN